MRVVVVGESVELEELVRRMVGRPAEVIPFVARSSDAAANLVVVEASRATAKLLEQVRAAHPDVPLVMLSSSNPASGRLRLRLTPTDLARSTYRQVVDRFGRDVEADYLTALLGKHEGMILACNRPGYTCSPPSSLIACQR